jgi:hypothetical protein
VSKPLNYLAIFFFGIILTLPSVTTLIAFEFTTPLQENRTKVSLPSSLECVKNINLDVCHRYLNDWFNDNYAPRDLFIKLQTQIDYTLFSSSDKVHIGDDDWLFYRSTLDTQKITNERVTDDEFTELLTRFDNLSKALSAKNIRLAIIPIPLKDTVYPEHLPSSVPNLPLNSRYKKLQKWLAEHDTIINIDAHEFLSKTKEQQRVFHKTDFHWNDPTGFKFAEALTNKLWQNQEGSLENIWTDTLSIRTADLSGGQASFLPLLVPPSEAGLFVKMNWKPTKGVYEYSPAKPWEYIYDGTNEPRAKLGHTVVLSDSFYDAFIRSGFEKYFKSIHRTRTLSSDINTVIANMPLETEIVIIEFIEVYIARLAQNGFGDEPTHTTN